jgi:hypothetical protein
MAPDILRPHSLQDGFVYIRVPRAFLKPRDPSDTYPWMDVEEYYVDGERAIDVEEYYVDGERAIDIWYPDRYPECRVISSRRTEEAVEEADYLARCKAEGLAVIYGSSGDILLLGKGPDVRAKTLRRAYRVYKAREAS